MTTYTEEDGLIGITINLQSKMESCSKEVLKSYEKFVRLESDLAITKNANK